MDQPCKTLLKATTVGEVIEIRTHREWDVPRLNPENVTDAGSKAVRILCMRRKSFQYNVSSHLLFLS